ncbi:hypothetical protein KKA77_01815 [Patescibacteria group bacterium]|nr:hypothetical protein [Patescibacteria group bacterium]
MARIDKYPDLRLDRIEEIKSLQNFYNITNIHGEHTIEIIGNKFDNPELLKHLKSQEANSIC